MIGGKNVILTCSCALAFFAAAFVPTARADEWNKKTILTFNRPVEIPGKVLPSGSYVFKLFDSASDRGIVQVFDKAEDKVLATFIAIPDYRFEPTGKTVVKFSERAAGAPEAIQAWFYPGDLYGLEFVYPKTRALELAKASKQTVLAMPNEVATNITKPVKSMEEPSVRKLRTTPLSAVTPEQNEMAMNKVVKSEPVSKSPNKAANKEVAKNESSHLPKTASDTPLIFLIGLLSLAVALGLGIFAKRVV